MNLKLFVLLACVSGYANAATIISPTAASASNEFGDGYRIVNTINQSGLSAGFTSGVTDFDSYFATNPTHTTLALNNEFFTAEGVSSVIVNYDLGSVYGIDKFALWNEEFSGLGKFSLFSSTDNANFSSLATSLSGTDHLITNDPYLANIFTFSLTNARYIRLEASGCPQPNSGFDGCGIGEVAFSVAESEVNAVPIPAALPLMLSGLAAFSMFRRKNKKAD